MQIAHTVQMRAKAPGQLKAAKAAADSLLSPEEQHNKNKNKNLRDRQKLLKLTAETERQIEGGDMSTPS